jgi:hypothetical protein
MYRGSCIENAMVDSKEIEKRPFRLKKATGARTGLFGN